MDSQFMEFWGNALLAAARSQKHFDEFNRWIRQGFEGASDLNAAFKKIYGLDQSDMDPDQTTDAWRAATKDFKQSYEKFFRQLGWVPKADYDLLEEKFLRLEAESEQKDKIIARLRGGPRTSELAPHENVEVFRDLVRKQSDAFQKLMKNISGKSS